MPITSTAEKVYPFEVFFPAGEAGSSKNCKAKCNQIRTIDKKRLIKPLGKVPREKLKEIELALCIHLGTYFDKEIMYRAN
jgi:mRNA interferase MazF